MDLRERPPGTTHGTHMPATPAAPGADDATSTPAVYAAVDIGTVSTRLIVARANTVTEIVSATGAGKSGAVDGGTAATDETNGGPAWTVLGREAQITDLGEGVDATGRLSEAAVGRTLAAVDGYLAVVEQVAREAGGPALVAATTTSAARDAENAEALLGPLAERGLSPQVISGDTEARLALLGVTSDFVGRGIVVADIGGGSTELIAGSQPARGPLAVEGDGSFNVGCRRVTERFFPEGGPVPPDAQRRARAFVIETLAPFFARMRRRGGVATGGSLADSPADSPAAKPSHLPELVCVGGTATSLVSVANALAPYDPAFVHLHRMGRDEVHAQAIRLAGLTPDELRALPGLQPKRARVIAAGALILDALLEAGGWDGFSASESDSLIGLLRCIDAEARGGVSPIGWSPAARAPFAPRR